MFAIFQGISCETVMQSSCDGFLGIDCDNNTHTHFTFYSDVRFLSAFLYFYPNMTHYKIYSFILREKMRWRTADSTCMPRTVSEIFQTFCTCFEYAKNSSGSGRYTHSGNVTYSNSSGAANLNIFRVKLYSDNKCAKQLKAV